VERLADHDDRAVAIGADHHEVTRVRLGAARGVDRRTCRLDRALDEARRVVVAERREQVQLCGGACELEERDAAATAGERAWLVEMRDVSGAGDRRDATERDVLDVTDDSDAELR
jgi:hypothetical protein